MRVCLIGDFSSKNDEGYRNIAHNLMREMDGIVDVIAIDAQPLNPRTYWKVARCKPDIIHYLSAPTLPSHFLTFASQALTQADAKTVISCLHPKGMDLISHSVLGRIAAATKPDLAFVQDRSFESKLQSRGYRTSKLPNGVDHRRFKPITSSEKKRLRRKFGIEEDKFVILHVGHIINRRGLSVLPHILKERCDLQGIVVGSSYFKTDESLEKELVKSGCLVLRQYFEHIEEIYQLSDLYIFPVEKRESILMPLSVLESLACGVPVVSRGFDSLREWLGESNGLYSVENENEICEAVDSILERGGGITKPFPPECTWKEIAGRMVTAYQEVLEDG